MWLTCNPVIYEPIRRDISGLPRDCEELPRRNHGEMDASLDDANLDDANLDDANLDANPANSQSPQPMAGNYETLLADTEDGNYECDAAGDHSDC